MHIRLSVVYCSVIDHHGKLHERRACQNDGRLGGPSKSTLQVQNFVSGLGLTLVQGPTDPGVQS